MLCAQSKQYKSSFVFVLPCMNFDLDLSVLNVVSGI